MAAQDGSKKYHVTVSGPDVNIDTMTDETVARVVMHVVMSGMTTPRVGVAPSEQQRKPTSLTSLHDFVAASGGKSASQQILAIAEFVCATGNKDEFTRDEIGEKFALAGLPAHDGHQHILRDVHAPGVGGILAVQIVVFLQRQLTAPRQKPDDQPGASRHQPHIVHS